MDREDQLFDVVLTLRPHGLVLGFGQGRQQHRRQDRDNGDDHQQFNESESVLDSFGEHVGRFHGYGYAACFMRLP